MICIAPTKLGYALQRSARLSKIVYVSRHWTEVQMAMDYQDEGPDIESETSMLTGRVNRRRQ